MATLRGVRGFPVYRYGQASYPPLRGGKRFPGIYQYTAATNNFLPVITGKKLGEVTSCEAWKGRGRKHVKHTKNTKKFSKNCQSSRLSMVILHRPNRQRTRHAMASHRIASVQKHLRALSATTQDIWHGIRHRIALRQFGAEKAKRCRPHLCQAWPDLSQTSLQCFAKQNFISRK